MCITIKKYSRLKTAKEDMVTYKFLIKKGGKFLTPFRKQEIKLQNTYGSIIGKKLESNVIGSWEINEGIYSFIYREEVLGLLIHRGLFFDHDNGFIIAKCIIPIESKYYTGHLLEHLAVVSNALEYIEFRDF